ncbi:DUF6438 domain-containing protein [Ekhidna sp. To15]|uniref:DUF6438 domain-containing protein n=1 Tax=Ekhidna sp. To15 TaxID=3395267 RepID=UPI003F528A17
MKRIWIIVFLLIVYGCASQKNQSTYAINYSSFACMGSCPVYKVKIDSLRNLNFEGIENVEVGLQRFKLNREEFRKVQNIVNEIAAKSNSDTINVSAIDSGGKELEVLIDGEKIVFTMENDKPRMEKLNSIIDEILSARGLIN